MSRNGRHRYDDPVDDVVTEMYHALSEELGTDGPVETFGHPDEHVVGRLIEEDEGVRTDVTSEVLAFDSHDIEDLSAEEAAIHLMDDEDTDDARDPSLTRSVRQALKEF